MRTTILSLALFLTASLPAMGEDPEYPMPTEDLFSDEVLGREFEYRKSVPYGDEDLAIALPLRKSWTWVEVSGDPAQSARRMVPLAAAHPPGDRSVVIEMSYMTLEREVRLEDWVDIQLDLMGWFAVQGQIGNYHDRRVVDAVLEYEDAGGDLRVARAGFFKTGDKVFLIAGSAPRAKYETYAGEFALAVIAGTPQRISTSPYAEDMIDYPDLGGYTFRFPKSWSETPSSASEEGVECVDLYDGTEKSATGLIKVRVYPRRRFRDLTPDQATWSAFEELKARDPEMKVVEKVQSLEASTDLFPRPGRMTVYRITLSGTPAEVHEIVLDGPDALVSILLVVPPKETLPARWLIGHRAWTIVQSTLRKAE